MQQKMDMMIAVSYYCVKMQISVRLLDFQKIIITDVRDHISATPLHRAVLAGKKSTCALLLENKADVHAQDSQGKILPSISPASEVNSFSTSIYLPISIQRWKEDLHLSISLLITGSKRSTHF